MEIKITETGEIKQLNLLTPDGDDWARDFISNYWSDIKWDEEQSTYTCSADTYAYWDPLLAKFQNLYSREDRLFREHGKDAVYAVETGAGLTDLTEEPSNAHEAYDEAFGKDFITYYVPDRCAQSDGSEYIWDEEQDACVYISYKNHDERVADVATKQFRKWAEKQIELKFPRYYVRVEAKQYSECDVYTNDDEARERIEYFTSELLPRWWDLPVGRF